MCAHQRCSPFLSLVFVLSPFTLDRRIPKDSVIPVSPGYSGLRGWLRSWRANCSEVAACSQRDLSLSLSLVLRLVPSSPALLWIWTVRLAFSHQRSPSPWPRGGHDSFFFSAFPSADAQPRLVFPGSARGLLVRLAENILPPSPPRCYTCAQLVPRRLSHAILSAGRPRCRYGTRLAQKE